MVYGLAAQSQGALCLASQVGVGTTVELYFPIADSTLRAANKLHAPNQLPIKYGHCAPDEYGQPPSAVIQRKGLQLEGLAANRQPLLN